MARMVQCVVLKREAEGLEYPPVPGELGQKLYENISQEAWEQWTKIQTMLINENRLSLADDQAQKILMEKLEEFFYGNGVAPPPDYKAPE